MCWFQSHIPWSYAACHCATIRTPSSRRSRYDIQCTQNYPTAGCEPYVCCIWYQFLSQESWKQRSSEGMLLYICLSINQDWADWQQYSPFNSVNIGILVSEESPCISHHFSEIWGSSYFMWTVDVMNKKVANFQKIMITISHNLLWHIVKHNFCILLISKPIWIQTVWRTGLT